MFLLWKVKRQMPKTTQALNWCWPETDSRLLLGRGLSETASASQAHNTLELFLPPFDTCRGWLCDSFICPRDQVFMEQVQREKHKQVCRGQRSPGPCWSEHNSQQKGLPGTQQPVTDCKQVKEPEFQPQASTRHIQPVCPNQWTKSWARATGAQAI
jgi:hypothetical protein